MPENQQTTPRVLGAPAAREAAAAAAEQDRLRAEARDGDGFVPLAADLRQLDAPPPPPLTPAPAPASSPPADEEAERPDLAGKRVVLVGDSEGDGLLGWKVLADVANHVHAPRLYDGTRDEAIRAALDDERNAELADMVRGDPARFLLVSVPAASWAPAPVKPKVTKTTWVVVR